MNSKTKIVVSFAAGAAVILTLAACGQKGPLVLPSAAATADATQAPGTAPHEPAGPPASSPR